MGWQQHYWWISYFAVEFQLESAFQHLRKLEEETRKAEAQRREQDRLEAAKRKEVQRITNVICKKKKNLMIQLRNMYMMDIDIMIPFQYNKNM